LWSIGFTYRLGKKYKRLVEVVQGLGRHLVIMRINFAVERDVSGFDHTLPYAINLGAKRVRERGRGRRVGRGRGRGGGGKATLLPQITMGMRLPAVRGGGGGDVNDKEGVCVS
jgi:hypothetical protein